MSQPNDRIWILLVQKSPKGPFTLTEVNALLEKGIIRRNDLALKMEPKEGAADGKKVGGSWKILWQYPEFDRRQEERAQTDAIVPAPPREGDRRSPLNEEKKAGLVKELLPEELGEIKAEDLIGKSTREIRNDESASGTEVTFNSDLGRPPDEEAGAPKWIYALILVAVGGGLYGWLSANNPLAKRSTPAVTAATTDSVPTGGSTDDVPPIRRAGASPLSRGLSSPAARRLPIMQLPRRSDPPAAPSARRDPEPSRREETRYDSPMEERQAEADRGEITAEDSENNASEEANDEAPKRAPAARGRRAKEAISEEDEATGTAPNAEATADPAPPTDSDAPAESD